MPTRISSHSGHTAHNTHSTHITDAKMESAKPYASRCGLLCRYSASVPGGIAGQRECVSGGE